MDCTKFHALNFGEPERFYIASVQKSWVRENVEFDLAVPRNGMVTVSVIGPAKFSPMRFDYENEIYANSGILDLSGCEFKMVCGYHDFTLASDDEMIPVKFVSNDFRI